MSIVIAIIPDTGSAEVALNNLAEAEFDPENISVIANTPSVSHALADPHGPFKNINASKLSRTLEKIGVPSDIAKQYQSNVMQNKVFIAIETKASDQETAFEMLQDYHPQLLQII